MQIAVVGATGLVGGEMLKVLSENSIFDNAEIIAVASAKSVGKKIPYKACELEVISVENALEAKLDIAIFSAGGTFSKKYAKLFVEKGATVIDNSSAWRMEKDIALIVPEINASELQKSDKIIANPNCSTIQMVMALASIHNNFVIKRLVISTYQSVTGSGVKGVNQLTAERNGEICKNPAYPHSIDKNVIPHGGDFEQNGYTTEETKLENETKKILNDQSIKITATVVRVPVEGGHSISVNIETCLPFEISEIKDGLSKFPGIIVEDDPKNNIYPMPNRAKNRDEVFVGRIRRDNSCENGINLWIVADNLRKGAATNAVQIAEYLLKNKLV